MAELRRSGLGCGMSPMASEGVEITRNETAALSQERTQSLAENPRSKGMIPSAKLKHATAEGFRVRPVTEEENTGLTWERRLVLWLPRPLLFGALLLAACLSVVYLIFQWYFEFPVDHMAILLTRYIAFMLMSVRWGTLAEALGRQRYGLAVPISDP